LDLQQYSGIQTILPVFFRKADFNDFNKVGKRRYFNKRELYKLHFDRTKWYCINEPLIRERKLTLKSPALVVLENGYIEGANEQFDSFLQENCILPFGKMEDTKKENENLPNGKMTFPQMEETIPSNKTDNKPNNKKRVQNLENFVAPSLLEISEFIKKENIKSVVADCFFNFYQGKNWMVGKNKMQDWESQIKVWESREFEKNKKPNPIPAVINAVPTKTTLERKQLIENFKRKTIGFVEKLRTNASTMETARINFNKQCNYPNEFNSQAVFTTINWYQIHLMSEPNLISEDDLQNITIEKFGLNFSRWFRKQKHGADLFSETPNKAHKPTELQQ